MQNNFNLELSNALQACCISTSSIHRKWSEHEIWWLKLYMSCVANVNLKHDAIFLFYTGGDGICAHFVFCKWNCKQKATRCRRNCKTGLLICSHAYFLSILAIAIKIVGKCSKLRLGQVMCLLSSAICVTCMICAVFLLHDLCCFCVFSLLFFFLTTVLMGWCVFIRVLVLLLINAKKYSSSVFPKKDCMLLYKLQYLFQL